MAWRTLRGGRRSPDLAPRPGRRWRRAPARVGAGVEVRVLLGGDGERRLVERDLGPLEEGREARARRCARISSSGHPGRHVLVVPALGPRQFQNLGGHLRRRPRAGPSGEILERVCQPSPAGGDLPPSGRAARGPPRRGGGGPPRRGTGRRAAGSSRPRSRASRCTGRRSGSTRPGRPRRGPARASAAPRRRSAPAPRCPA